MPKLIRIIISNIVRIYIYGNTRGTVFRVIKIIKVFTKMIRLRFMIKTMLYLKAWSFSTKERVIVFRY